MLAYSAISDPALREALGILAGQIASIVFSAYVCVKCFNLLR